MDKISFDSKANNLLLTQVKSYINSAPLRRIKRTGSIGLSNNTIRNLQRFYVLIKEFENNISKPIYLSDIDHSMVSKFQEWLLSSKMYSVNNAGLQLKLLKMVCKEAERKGVAVNTYSRQIESFTQRSKDRILQTLSFEEIDFIKNLKDSLELERFAREKYLMKKENEDIYIIEFDTIKK